MKPGRISLQDTNLQQGQDELQSLRAQSGQHFGVQNRKSAKAMMLEQHGAHEANGGGASERQHDVRRHRSSSSESSDRFASVKGQANISSEAEKLSLDRVKLLASNVKRARRRLDEKLRQHRAAIARTHGVGAAERGHASHEDLHDATKVSELMGVARRSVSEAPVQQMASIRKVIAGIDSVSEKRRGEVAGFAGAAIKYVKASGDRETLLVELKDKMPSLPVASRKLVGPATNRAIEAEHAHGVVIAGLKTAAGAHLAQVKTGSYLPDNWATA